MQGLQELTERIRQLEQLDTQLQIFGASIHRYKLRPCLTKSTLGRVERTLRIELPRDLRRFYTLVGDGIAGPFYGLRPATELRTSQPEQPYPGADHYRQLARESGILLDNGYFEIDPERIVGLVNIIHKGCGHLISIAANGPRSGKVSHVSCDGFISDTDQTLLELYNEWLSSSIGAFDRMLELMQSSSTLEEIREKLSERGRSEDIDLMASIANVPKPEHLFGTPPHTTIRSGRRQSPWYREVLGNWRKKNGLYTTP